MKRLQDSGQIQGHCIKKKKKKAFQQYPFRPHSQVIVKRSIYNSAKHIKYLETCLQLKLIN